MPKMLRNTLIASFAIVILGGFGMYIKAYQAMPEKGPEFVKIPLNIDDFYGEEQRFEEYAYDVLKADTTTLRLYRNSDREAFWLFMAYFSSQKYGSQIHSPKHCLPGGGFRINTIEPFPITLDDGREIVVNRLMISNPQRSELMFYWYETRSGVISDEFGLKLDLAKNSLLFLPTDAAICRFTMPIPPRINVDKATKRIVDIIKEMYPSMQDALPFSG
jgi:EpsI family protein